MIKEAQKAGLKAHIEAERARDIDAIMASLSDDPFYMIPNFSLRGRDALRAMYERSMAQLTEENADEYLRALDDPAVVRWGDDHILLEYTRDYPLHWGMVVAIHFDGDKVRSEHTYFTFAERFRGVPEGDDFLAVPGVERLG